jgi:hypothetical protein
VISAELEPDERESQALAPEGRNQLQSRVRILGFPQEHEIRVGGEDQPQAGPNDPNRLDDDQADGCRTTS